MSENKRKQLIETLTTLNKEDRIWAINFLVQLLAGQTMERKARVVGRNYEGFTEKQCEEYFAGAPVHDFPTETPPLDREFLHATAGKTIEPLKKWL